MDFGTYAIKAVEVLASPKGLAVVRFAHVLTPAESIGDDGHVENARPLVHALRALLTELRPGTKHTVLAVGAQSTFVRRIQFPPMPRKELLKAVELQTERLIPFARDGANFDFEVLPQAEGAQEVPVLLVGAPTRIVDGLVAVCRAAGLKPAAVETDGMAYYRAMVATGLLAAGESAAVLDLGNTNAKLTLYEGGLPVMARKLGVSVSLLEKYAWAFRIPDRAPWDQIYPWFDDVRRSLDFLLVHTRLAGLAHLFLTGGGANMEGLGPSLELYLKQRLPARLDAGFRVGLLDLSAVGMSLEFAQAFGLAIPEESVHG